MGAHGWPRKRGGGPAPSPPSDGLDHRAQLAPAGKPEIQGRANPLGGHRQAMTGRHDDPLGGRPRTPTFSVRIAAECVIVPPVALAGCEIGDGCYVATALGALQDARLGRGSRLADLYCACRSRAAASGRVGLASQLGTASNGSSPPPTLTLPALRSPAPISQSGALDMSTAIKACCIQAAAKPSCNRQLRMDRRAGQRPRLGPIPPIRHAEASPATDAVGVHGVSVSALSGRSSRPHLRAELSRSHRGARAPLQVRASPTGWCGSTDITVPRIGCSLRRGYDEA